MRLSVYVCPSISTLGLSIGLRDDQNWNVIFISSAYVSRRSERLREVGIYVGVNGVYYVLC